MERSIDVTLTARELHVLTCAMAGNFPPKLDDVRMPTLRKLAHASHTLKKADREICWQCRGTGMACSECGEPRCDAATICPTCGGRRLVAAGTCQRENGEDPPMGE